MNAFLTLFHDLITISSKAFIVIPIQIASFIILTKIVTDLLNLTKTKRKFNYETLLFVFFIIPIAAIMVDNIATITKFIIPKTPFYRSINCLAWVLSCIKFYSLILFLEQLIYKKINWNNYHKIFCLFELLLCSSFVVGTVRAILYNESYHFIILFYFGIVIFSFISVAFVILKQLSNQKLPIILKQQLKTLLFYFLCPHFICILLELMPIILFDTHRIIALSNLETILITASIYFCFKKIMQFRFLNLSDHVKTQSNLHAATDFKECIEEINIASTEQELNYISQQFFFDHIGIVKADVHFYIRSNNQPQDNTQKLIENFLINTQTKNFNPFEILLQHKVLVSHEIEFDEFYTDNNMISYFSEFLCSINADIFLPIINNKKLLGYITIQKQNPQVMFNYDEQNKIIVFAKFLAPAIYMLQQQNTFKLLQESKEIKEELYAKQQEISQYKESIKQLLKDRLEHYIGIIFYNGKHFSFKNQEAQSLLSINPNLAPDHPTSIMLKNFAHQVEKFQTVQNMYLTLSNGSKLMISGMPQAQTQGGTLLIIRKPEATDLIKMHIDNLKNPTYRDYLLYLATTKAGQIINQLLPNNNERFLNIKIQLLQATLQKSALVLEMHPDDINPIAEIVHQLSGKQTLHIINLQPQHNMQAEKIFGINPLLSNQEEQPLLEKLSNGTLLIKNIELLDITSQQKLAHFLRYGIFTPVKSEQRKFSETRIICATSNNLLALYNEGMIIPELYQELTKHYLQLPSLITMNDQEKTELIDSFMYQNIQKSTSLPLRPLNYKDKNYLISKHTASLFALQQKVEWLMNLKPDHAENAIIEEKISATNKFYDSCPEIQLAAQLGKHALKDVQLMKRLWKQLGNQTKIADLLGVNRSSVNRRCKEYNLV